MSKLSNRQKRPAEGGFTTVEWMVAATFSLIVMVMLFNFIAVQYGQGVMRAAADEGARAGARVQDNPQQVCRTREQDVLSSLGGMAEGLTSTCDIVGGKVQAHVTATFTGWLPFVPNYSADIHATSVSESAPAPV